VSSRSETAPLAWFGGTLATGLADVTSDPAALDSTGWWAVVATFEGALTLARFRDVRRAPLAAVGWPGVDRSAWSSSMSHGAYVAAVERIRKEIAAGEVYQVNVCRVLQAALPPGADVVGLAGALAAGNPAPYAGVVRLPTHGIAVASASPELFLSRSGDVVASGPIKGTGRTVTDLQPKDVAENVMIVDLVRNDLGRVASVGTVEVAGLCEVDEHPGLVHLTSTVRARLRPGAGWAELLDVTLPPGSVSGAPKSSAIRLIREVEPVARGTYCGGVGWVDADRKEGCLAVGIRTFWTTDDQLLFGTGAGITWGSDAEQEWAETELKAANLLTIAARGWPAGRPG
jgi:para-aminobenzoate synthetase component 1